LFLITACAMSNGFRVGKVVLEGQNIAHICSPEAVDRLIVITDHRHVAMLRAEDLHELVLRLVRVLILIDEQMQKTVLVILANGVGFTKQRHRAQQEVVEVERRRTVQLALIRPVNARDLLLHGVG
jgi:hypothetical protein